MSQPLIRVDRQVPRSFPTTRFWKGPESGKAFEVKFVDSPRFDDRAEDDAFALKEIANWISRVFANGIKTAGVLHLHGITKNRVGGSGYRNLKLLSKIVGNGKLEYLTLCAHPLGHLEKRRGRNHERGKPQGSGRALETPPGVL